jgi:hypothetical protein
MDPEVLESCGLARLSNEAKPTFAKLVQIKPVAVKTLLDF